MSFSLVVARDIKGHEDAVRAFEADTDTQMLSEAYVVTRDAYYVDYHSGYSEVSEINTHKPYVPRIGCLIEATHIGRDETDVFYKLLAKKNYGYTLGGVYTTPCEFLFVRTNLKQTYKVTHRFSMQVSGCDKKLKYVGTRKKPVRVNLSQYMAHKRRKERETQATPKWADKRLEAILRKEVRRKNQEAGYIKYHLDHIIPLCHELVCGLNVFTNMRIVLADYNVRKSNKFDIE